jgi:hypothetical protein
MALPPLMSGGRNTWSTLPAFRTILWLWALAPSGLCCTLADMTVSQRERGGGGGGAAAVCIQMMCNMLGFPH